MSRVGFISWVITRREPGNSADELRSNNADNRSTAGTRVIGKTGKTVIPGYSGIFSRCPQSRDNAVPELNWMGSAMSGFRIAFSRISRVILINQCMHSRFAHLPEYQLGTRPHFRIFVMQQMLEGLDGRFSNPA